MAFLTSRRSTWLAVVMGATLVFTAGCATDDDELWISTSGGGTSQSGDPEVPGAGSDEEPAPGSTDESGSGTDEPGQPGAGSGADLGRSDGICHFELVIDGVTTTAPDAATIAPDGRILYKIDGNGALARVHLFGGKNMPIGHVSGVARGFSNPRGSDPITGVGTFAFGQASFDLRDLGGKQYAALPGTFDAEITAFDPPTALAGVVSGELSVSQGRFPFTLSFEVTDAIEFPSGFLGC